MPHPKYHIMVSSAIAISTNSFFGLAFFGCLILGAVIDVDHPIFQRQRFMIAWKKRKNFGGFFGGNGSWYAALEEIQKKTGKKPACISWFHSWLMAAVVIAVAFFVPVMRLPAGLYFIHTIIMDGLSDFKNEFMREERSPWEIPTIFRRIFFFFYIRLF